MTITILGQGAMGSRMANRLEAAGHQVIRWNRTGGTMTSRDAVADADIVIAMLRDDDASRAVWLDPGTGALAGMKASALAVESSTLTTTWVHKLHAEAKARGIAFIDAPVLGSRPQAEAGQLVHLIGGADGDLARAMPVFAAMGGLQLHAGPVGSGATLKLIANALFAVQVAAMAELIPLSGRLGLDPAQAIAMLGQTAVMSMAAKGASGLMLSNAHDPQFPVDLIAKDLRYAIGDQDGMAVTRATLSQFQAANTAGLGDRNLTAVALIAQ
jgi:3-hydroxyisobutyrate dehydrogenase